jgi:predicted transcriptional regulator
MDTFSWTIQGEQSCKLITQRRNAYILWFSMGYVEVILKWCERGLERSSIK